MTPEQLTQTCAEMTRLAKQAETAERARKLLGIVLVRRPMSVSIWNDSRDYALTVGFRLDFDRNNAAGYNAVTSATMLDLQKYFAPLAPAIQAMLLDAIRTEADAAQKAVEAFRPPQ